MNSTDGQFEDALAGGLRRIAETAPAGPDASEVFAALRRRRACRAAMGGAA